MLVVTEVVSIASEKVTEMLSIFETHLWLSSGEINETVGAVVSVVVVSVVVSSVVVVVSVADSSFSPHEKMKILKIMEIIISVCLKELQASGLGIK